MGEVLFYGFEIGLEIGQTQEFVTYFRVTIYLVMKMMSVNSKYVLISSN